MDDDRGLRTAASRYTFDETVQRMVFAIEAGGGTIFARIDHADGARAVGLPLGPTMLIIFGNAKAGTPLMQAQRTVGIDLPLKILLWQDEAGSVWTSYNDPAWIARRHGLDPDGPSVKAMGEALARLAASLQ